MKVRLYMDEDSMEDALTRALRARGVDVIIATDVGMVDRDDPEHLAYATKNARVVCTFNIKDFMPLHSQYMKSG